MNVILMGRYRTPYPYTKHSLDVDVMRALAADIDHLDLVVEASDGRQRTWREDNLAVHYVVGSKLRWLTFVPRALIAVAKLSRRQRIDVFNGSDLVGSAVGLLLRPVLGYRLVVQLQDDYLCPSPVLYSLAYRTFLRRVAIFLARRADAVRCLYQSAARQLHEAGIDRKKVVVIPSRCDPTRFASNPGVSRDGSSILFVGSLVRRKGADVLLIAMKDVLGFVPDARLHLLGEGPDTSSLEALAVALEIDKSVIFLGRKMHEEIAEELATAAVFVLPSFSEATPRALMEAMVMEVPVVATRVGGVPEMLDGGKGGKLVEPGDPIALADAIVETLEHPDEARARAIHARQRVLTSYTTERHVVEMRDLHARVASAARSHR